MKARTRARKNVGGWSAKGPLERLAEARRLLIDTESVESLTVLLDMLEESGETLSKLSEQFYDVADQYESSMTIPRRYSNEVSIARGNSDYFAGYFPLAASHQVGLAWSISQRPDKNNELQWRGIIHPIWNGAIWNESIRGASPPVLPSELLHSIIAGADLQVKVNELNAAQDDLAIPADFPYLSDYAPRFMLTAWRCVVVLKQIQVNHHGGGDLDGNIDVPIGEVMDTLRESVRSWRVIANRRLMDPPDSIVWNDPRRPRENPAMTDAQFVAEIQRLLHDPDPATVDVIQDMLLERHMTLADVSRQLPTTEEDGFDWREWSKAAGHTESGVFEVTPAKGRFRYATGVVWSVGKTSTGRKWFAHVVVHIEGDGFNPGGIGRRFETSADAVKAAVELAWKIAVLMKRGRHHTFEEIKTDVTHDRMIPSSAIPRELVDGFPLTTRGDMPERGDLKDNPAWVTHSIADAFASLSSQVPPQWMPKLDDVRGGPRGTLVAQLKEYGCGSYGCVLPTLDPEIVLKVTTDETEAQFASQLAHKLVAPICVEYHMAVSLAARHEGRPIYLLWREGADDVGEVDKVIGVEAGYYIDEQHKAAQAAYLALRRRQDSAALLTAWEEACHELAVSVPELEPLAMGLIEVYRRQRIFMGDIHTGNIGRVFRGDDTGVWVITDPGHVAVLG